MRRLLLRLLYGAPAWRIMWALELRCRAADVRVTDAMTDAGWLLRDMIRRFPDSKEITRRGEAISRLIRQHPRLPHETAVTLVRLAAEGMAVEDAGR